MYCKKITLLQICNIIAFIGSFLKYWGHTEQTRRNIKGNQKGNIKCYARERANTKQPF
jgi:hypothetical protein